MNCCSGPQPVFNGYPQYLYILSKLMRLNSNMKDVEQKFPTNILFEGPLLKEGRKRVIGKFQVYYIILNNKNRRDIVYYTKII